VVPKQGSSFDLCRVPEREIKYSESENAQTTPRRQGLCGMHLRGPPVLTIVNMGALECLSLGAVMVAYEVVTDHSDIVIGAPLILRVLYIYK
jgi:hypothetical protein